MTIQEYFDAWNGKYREVAGGGDALNQCVDNANGFLRDVRNVDIIEHANARDFWDRLPSDKFDKILNTPDGVPQRGDIVIWDAWEYGHIAIAEGTGDTGWFRSFDQNFPIGSPCHFVDHNYYGVKGWLRYKEDIMTEGEKLDVAKALCRARTGMLIGSEVDYIKANYGPGKSPFEDYASINILRDNHIPAFWLATTGESCPVSEIDHWQRVFINNELQIIDLARTWYNDHVVSLLKQKDAKIIELENKPPDIKEVEKVVEKIVEKKVLPEDLGTWELFAMFINKLFGGKNVQDKDNKNS